MLFQNRVIFDNNGTLEDFSVETSDYKSASKVMAFVSGEDYLYIGGDMPFNHRYFDMAVVNDQAATVTVDIWDGSEWEAAVDVLDETSSGGVSLAGSGLIRWTPERDTTWGTEDTTENIPDLAELKIYDLYWVRLKWNASLKATTAFNYIGHRFSNDADLAIKYPNLLRSNILAAFQTGKTDWDDQHFYAAEEIILKMRKKKQFFSPNLILDPSVFEFASIHRVAYNIYSSFGDEYEDNQKKADAEFMKAFNGIDFDFDKDMDGRMDIHDKVTSVAWRRR